MGKPLDPTGRELVAVPIPGADNAIESLIQQGRVDPESAVEDIDARRREWQATQHPRDARVAAAYAALVEDETSPLFDVQKVIGEAGLSSAQATRHMPRLAIVRADKRYVDCTIERLGIIRYTSGRRVMRRNLGWQMAFDFDRRWWDGSAEARQKTGRAQAPYIPPQYRPEDKLANYLLLWEARWTLPERNSPPPRDPALLKKVVGHVYTVHASWELTELEEAALRGD